MKRRAIAIAAVRKHPFSLALESAQNSMLLLADLMYGTPERMRATYGVAILLTTLALILSSGSANAMQVCPV